MDAVPLTVALLAIITAGGGIGVWLGILTTRQKQAKSDLERLQTLVDELLALRRSAARTQSEEVEEILQRLRRS